MHWMFVGLVLLAAAGCATDDERIAYDPECKDACEDSGFCISNGKSGCQVRDDADCQQSRICQEDGWCHAKMIYLSACKYQPGCETHLACAPDPCPKNLPCVE